jgi:hypothetical protein
LLSSLPLPLPEWVSKLAVKWMMATPMATPMAMAIAQPRLARWSLALAALLVWPVLPVARVRAGRPH